MRLSHISTERSRRSQGVGGQRRYRRLIVISCVLAAGASVWYLMPDAAMVAGESDDFQLAALELKGLSRLTSDQVLQASGVALGDNIFILNLDDIAARLDSLVWVKSATIQRKPPDRLTITIAERRRLAWVTRDGRTYGVDEERVLLPADSAVGQSRAGLDLPVIVGIEVGSADSSAVSDSAFVRIVEWLGEAKASDSLFCQDISQVEPLGLDAVRLRLKDGLEVRLPIDEVGPRLVALKQILTVIYRDIHAPAYVDFRFSGQVVVGIDRNTGDVRRAALPVSIKEGAGYG